MLHPDEVGNRILQACLYLLPCDDGDEAFEWITKDWGGGGTTCGFLPSALMWLVGVRSELCNRTDPAYKMRYVDGANMARIFNRGRHPFTLHKTGATYPPGTILFVSNGPPITEHVCVLDSIEGDKWTVYEGGKKNRAGKECMRKAEGRVVAGASFRGKKIVGGIQPHHLPLVAEEIDVAHVVSSAWASRPARDPYTGELQK
jgi:hypothetical protein